MTKLEFISALRGKLNKFPIEEVEERINFYSEIIDDNIEDGHTEEEAVSKLGSVDEIARQIASEIPLAKIVKHNAKPKRSLKTWEIVLLIALSPIWFSLLIGLFAGVISVYAVLWSGIICIWAVAGALCVVGSLSAIGGVVLSFIKGTEGAIILGLGLFSLGLGIFMVFASKIITNYFIKYCGYCSRSYRSYNYGPAYGLCS